MKGTYMHVNDVNSTKYYESFVLTTSKLYKNLRAKKKD